MPGLTTYQVFWGSMTATTAVFWLPQLPATASRVSVPVYRDGIQVGKATSSTWSPTLKRMIALATVASEAAGLGTRLEMEFTVDHRRRQVGVTVSKLPFFDPPRKRA